MKKIIAMAALIFSSILTYACTDGARQKQAEKQETTQEGNVIVMNKDMFIKEIFDYEKSKEWKYKGDKPAIIDLYADWCGPCKMLSPVVESLADQYEGKVLVGKVNVDEEPDLARRFGVMSIPTVVFLKNGQEFDRKVGVMPPQAFSGVLDTNL